MSVSVCLIVKNEEKNLSRLLKSIKSFASEVIIVDTGSTDRTKDVIVKEISQSPRQNIRLYETTWENDFSKAKNESLKYASCEWIMALDADHVFVNTKENLEK